MIFNKDKYFINHGFVSDPFASTNAVHEDKLEEFFITPPYFYSLIGSIQTPKSSIVIAPRGAGKTAQRKMIEIMSASEDNIISIVYDQFPIENLKNITSITYEMHLRRIIKYLLIALLTKINTLNDKNIYDKYDKKNINILTSNFLTGITESEVNHALDSIKGVSEKVTQLWKSAGNSINSIINSVLDKLGIKPINLEFQDKKQYISHEELLDTIKIIEKLFNKIRVNAVFILIDSVDETVLTGSDSNKSYELIKPLIKELKILEQRTIVFKFFLWDKIQEHWAEDIRKDRIEIFEMTWSKEKIIELINKRLIAFSNGKYSSLYDILEAEQSTINYILDFANNSPRDAINIMKSIFDQFLFVSKDENLFPNNSSINKGLDIFCKNKFEELILKDKQRKDLKRIKHSTFTIPYLYNEVFKCNDSTARNILMPWTRAEYVISSSNKIKVKQSQNPINVYTIKDLRIARHVCSDKKIEEFISDNLIKCEECDTINVFNKNNSYGLVHWQCNRCQSNLTI
ncbi:P-loop ATPase, Sll1717 family [Arcobacter sp. CECT 8985]|uniref:P-loop ATPase, Sll1717 family n=1 Tax=Arcobacter sp. CECT 8985 TaxID=1935424 RepID=UPI00100A5BAF|nr:hypothetical protein [Arcobacter sp. CECT 8985]RXJ88191.1 hypothetical protein CRU93_00935 [Arcobacter sp. CECT 8985]